MKHSVPHSLGLEKARTVARAALDSYAKRFADYSPTTKWKDENSADIGFSIKGMSMKGALKVAEKSIDLDLEVPFMLKPFQGRAVGVIEDSIKEWIGKAQKGEI